MRLFVGVELDDAQRAACARAAGDLQRQLSGLRRFIVRWIPEENLHITLWFLGEVEEEPAKRLIGALQSDWRVAPFNLTIAGAGAFPPAGLPRIVWFGVTEGVESLGETYRDLAARFVPLGYEAERRPYHPHVTIGRVKEADRAESRQARDVFRKCAVRGGSRRVTAVTLFRTRLSPQGARYEPLLRVPLKGC